MTMRRMDHQSRDLVPCPSEDNFLLFFQKLKIDSGGDLSAT